VTENDPLEALTGSASTPNADPGMPLGYQAPTERPIRTRLRRHAVRWAWLSVLAEAVTFGAGVLVGNLLPNDRTPAFLATFIVFALCSIAGGVVAAMSLFGIDSRRTALLTIPGAVLGLICCAFNTLASLYVFALWGKRWG
jgi:hypothetical protein